MTRMTPPIVRFAPSPTGRLHIGNIRTASLNWLFARRHGGTFILRLDDTDVERSTAAFAAGIREDLAWLGLTWAREEQQSARIPHYENAAERLKAAGRLYPCYESEAELDRRRKLQLAQSRPPIYDRASLRSTDADRLRFEAEGRRPYWRFRLANTDKGHGLDPFPTLVTWQDLVRGDQSVDVGSLSDPVLIRADGSFLYTFTSVVDDIDLAISHVIRGEDHVTNTGVQIEIFHALGAEPPAFAHHSLLVGADGQALSKRTGALAVEGLRTARIEPLAIVCHAALLGTSDAVEPYTSLDALSERIDLQKISRAPGRFDLAELHLLNARLLHLLSYDDVKDRLVEVGINGGPAFWNAVRGNLANFDDAGRWWSIVHGPLAPVIEDPAFAETAARLLPHEPWSEATWGDWTGAIKAATGAKGRALFHPLRLALTGLEQGPELKALLPLIGRQRTLTRLAAGRGATGAGPT